MQLSWGMGAEQSHTQTGIRPRCLVTTALVLLALLAIPSGGAAEVQTRFLYKLANFNGRIDTTWARIAVDSARNEVYVVDQDMVRVFDANGMEIHRFAEDGRLGFVTDVAVRQSGDILVLSRTPTGQKVLVCDFRGFPTGELSIDGIPEAYAGFVPDQMVIKDRRLYFADNRRLHLVVTDENGQFQRGYELNKLLQIEEGKRGSTQIDGFSVDPGGNILFTIPVNFSAHALSPDGRLTSYVQPGGAPGKFNLVSGIVSDAQGFYYIADRLKNVVQIFDSNFSFIRQFGYRGPRSNNLFGPRYLAIDSRNRLHVSQLSKKGVSVFQVEHESRNQGGDQRSETAN